MFTSSILRTATPVVMTMNVWFRIKAAILLLTWPNKHLHIFSKGIIFILKLEENDFICYSAIKPPAFLSYHSLFTWLTVCLSDLQRRDKCACVYLFYITDTRSYFTNNAVISSFWYLFLLWRECEWDVWKKRIQHWRLTLQLVLIFYMLMLKFFKKKNPVLVLR